MNILLLSPYDAASHAYWRAGLVRHLDHRFTEVTLPARYFSWRFRGNSLTLATDPRLDADYDLIIATSMTDLSALRGMQPRIATIPTVLYFHENQFDYPDESAESHLLERRITSIYSAVAAERLVFNSDFNRQSFLAGARALLGRMPDHVPHGVVESLAEKSTVIPVALEEDCFQRSEKSERFSIIWNHRWEHDKGLLDLQALVVALIASGLEFQLHLVGQQFRQPSPIMEETARLLRDHDRLGQLGYVEDRNDYLALLQRSHCVLSTARHEFQGLAVQEAMASGCMPIVPNRLAYPEYVADANRYDNQVEAVALIGQACAKYVEPETTRLPRWRHVVSAWNDLTGASHD